MNAILLAIAVSVASPSAATPVKKPAKQMVCGEPRALLNDAVQTVRYCEFK